MDMRRSGLTTAPVISGLVSRHKVLVVALVVGVLLRAYFVATAHSTPPGDPNAYRAIVHAMLNGEGMVFHDQNLGDMWAFCPPLYALLMWLFSLPSGLTFGAVGSLNLLLDLGTVGALLWMGRLSGFKTELPAAAWFLWPASVILCANPYKEGLICLLTVLLACCVLDRRASSFGVVAALLALTQPALAPLAAVFALAFRMPLRFIAVSLATFCAVLLPWWVRNWLIFGQFVPLTSAGGLGLWIGVTPEGTGEYIMTPGRFIHFGDELAISRAAASEAWRIIAADPLGTAWHCLVKIGRPFITTNWANSTVRWLNPEAPLVVILAAAVPVVLAPFALFSAASVKLVARRDGILSRLMLAGFVQYVAGQFLFETSERHRYFLVPLCIMFVLRQSASSRTTFQS